MQRIEIHFKDGNSLKPLKKIGKTKKKGTKINFLPSSKYFHLLGLADLF